MNCAVCKKPFERKPSQIEFKNSYCSRKCFRKGMTGRKQTREHIKNRMMATIGEKCYNWRGGKHFHRGYILIHKPDHPFAHKRYVLEHRLVMEKYLRKYKPHSKYLVKSNGIKYLDPKCVIHHLDGNPSNNDFYNLYVYLNQAKHLSSHKIYKYRKRAKLVRHTFDCQWCKKEISRFLRPCDIRKRDKQKFCSISCSVLFQHYTQGHNIYSHNNPILNMLNPSNPGVILSSLPAIK
jgi:hypothetical protein